MEEARQQQAATMTEFNWLGRRFPISNAKTRVSILKGACFISFIQHIVPNVYLNDKVCCSYLQNCDQLRSWRRNYTAKQLNHFLQRKDLQYSTKYSLHIMMPGVAFEMTWYINFLS